MHAAPAKAGGVGRRKWLFGLLVLAAGASLYLLQGVHNQMRPVDVVYPADAALVALINETEPPEPPKSSTPAVTMVVTTGTGGPRVKLLIDTPGCKIPDMPATSSMISKFTRDVQPTPDCDKDWWSLQGKVKTRGPALVQSDLDSLYIGSLAKNMSCCYRPFTRAKPGTHNGDSKAIFSKECIPFRNRDRVKSKHEFVRVECFSNATRDAQLVYKDFHAFVPLKAHVEDRCSDAPNSPDQLSVVVLGIDSVSRLNMQRELPLTLGALAAAGAIPLLGYNKVADNTFPNLMPLLTGLSEGELKSGCPWPGPDHVIDACPFVWKKFAAAGFRTVYAEDCAWMATFNYAKSGFLQQPTDYYARPYLQSTEDQIGHMKKWNVKLCSGPRLTVDNILSYARKTAERFADSRWFGLFWSNSISHDLLTMPHIGDKAFASLVARLDLNRTALVVLSDHGMRWGPIRDTYQGWLESCLPAAFVALPGWFEKRFPAAVANLRANAATRLTTPFDIHATLLDLVDPEVQLLNPGGAATNKRGTSLFAKIPAERTCEQAGIPDTFCTCQVSRPLASTEVPSKASEAIVANLNSALMGAPVCAPLALESVLAARQMGQNHMQITVQVLPGKGHFQGTVSKVADGRFEVQGPIARMNLYGNSSWCVDTYVLKPVCFCL